MSCLDRPPDSGDTALAGPSGGGSMRGLADTGRSRSRSPGPCSPFFLCWLPVTSALAKSPPPRPPLVGGGAQFTGSIVFRCVSYVMRSVKLPYSSPWTMRIHCELATPPRFGECAGPCVVVVLHRPLARKLVVAERNTDALYFVLGAGQSQWLESPGSRKICLASLGAVSTKTGRGSVSLI